MRKYGIAYQVLLFREVGEEGRSATLPANIGISKTSTF